VCLTVLVAQTTRIVQIFDQSKKGNHIGLAPPGGAARHTDIGCNATKEKLTLGGNAVYAAYFEGGMGYRNETGSGVARGDDPESMYMVTNGERFRAVLVSAVESCDRPRGGSAMPVRHCPEIFRGYICGGGWGGELACNFV
jgi:hypothetical protein